MRNWSDGIGFADSSLVLAWIPNLVMICFVLHYESCFGHVLSKQRPGHGREAQPNIDFSATSDQWMKRTQITAPSALDSGRINHLS